MRKKFVPKLYALKKLVQTISVYFHIHHEYKAMIQQITRRLIQAILVRNGNEMDKKIEMGDFSGVAFSGS